MIQTGLLKSEYEHFSAIFLKQNVEVLEHLDRHSGLGEGNKYDGLRSELNTEGTGGDFLNVQYRIKGYT